MATTILHVHSDTTKLAGWKFIQIVEAVWNCLKPFDVLLTTFQMPFVFLSCFQTNWSLFFSERLETWWNWLKLADLNSTALDPSPTPQAHKTEVHRHSIPQMPASTISSTRTDILQLGIALGKQHLLIQWPVHVSDRAESPVLPQQEHFLK